MFEIIPAIDLYENRAVRLLRGSFSDVEVISQDPVALARDLSRSGAKMLHVVDLGGARSSDNSSYQLIRRMVEVASVPVQLGGGLRTPEQVKRAFDAGVSRVVLGTVAARDEELLASICRMYPGLVGVGLDIREGRVAIQGWEQEAEISIETLLERAKRCGAGFVVYTDVMRDGTMTGPNTEGLGKVLQATCLPVIVSGGIANEQQVSVLRNIAKGQSHFKGAIIGKAIYKGTVSLAGSNLCRRIIPCLDVDHGKVVKGTRFKDLQHSGDPVALARLYSLQGADELVMLDISATLEGRRTMLDTVASVAREVNIPLTVGGGVRSVEDGYELLRGGADKIALNTAAVRTPHLIKELAARFGTQCVVAAVDVRYTGQFWEVVVSAGREPTGIDAISWVRKLQDFGAGEILLTSIDCDGVKAGYDYALLREARKSVSVPIIASGGAGSVDDMVKAFELDIDACLAASIFHTEATTVTVVKQRLSEAGVKVCANY